MAHRSQKPSKKSPSTLPKPRKNLQKQLKLHEFYQPNSNFPSEKEQEVILGVNFPNEAKTRGVEAKINVS